MIKKIVVSAVILYGMTFAQLSGIKTVGNGGDYATLTLALNAWKTSTITGDVIFQLIDSIYNNETYPIVCTIPAGYSGGDWRLTIKPVSGIIARFEGTCASTMFDIKGIDRLTLDSLIISNRNQDLDTTGHAIRFINGSSDNIIKNCVLKASCSALSILYIDGGVVYFSTAEAPSGPGNNDNLIENCIITKSREDRSPIFGVCFRGSAAMYTRTNNNNTIKGCKIHDFERHGVYFSAYDSNTAIIGNEFYSTIPQNTTTLYGIRITATSVSGTQIIGNKFYNLMASGASPVIIGIYMTMASATNPPLVANNFISLDAETTHENAYLYGIRHLRQQASTNTYKFYYNSIYLGGNPTNGYSTGVAIKTLPTQNTQVDFVNNIVFNNRTSTSGNHYCIIDSFGGAGFISDYNDLYVPTPGVNGQYVGYRLGNLATLANWQVASYHDSNSINLNPNFLSPINLHVNPASSNVNNLGTYISDVLTDIDADLRHLTTPDIGADEYMPGGAYEEPKTEGAIADLQNIYPNPFKNQTTIRYHLNKSTPVRIKIYNCLGSEVKTLVDQHQASGAYSVNWNGKDNNGRSVGNGLYILRVITDTETGQYRLLLIK